MGLVDETEFHYFHFFPYTNLPANHKERASLWVDFPNSNYDPKLGSELYNRYLDEMVLADKLGYDGIVLNEHHNTQYTMNPAPNLTAAALIPQTKGWVSVFGTPPNFEYPNRLAEEYAMLDVMSRGRLRVAFPLGTGMEYWANAVNPATARARFRESLDIILKCWTDDGPQSYAGDFYSYRYLNPWPKPVQQPYPECYIVGTGSPETIELAAELGFGYSVVFIPTEVQLRVFDQYRERLAAHGHAVTPDKVTIGIFAYVAENEELAQREFMPHLMYFFEDALRTTPRYLVPARLRDGARVPQARAGTRRARVGQLGRPRRDQPHRGGHARAGGRRGGQLDRGRGHEPREPEPHDRRHAELEGREEHDPVRGRGHPPPAQEEGGRSVSTVTFDKLTFDVQGTETVVLAAGNPDAPPLVFFHGGGTFHGWAFAEPWTSVVPRPHPVPPRLR